jgi:hypothetical protein
MTSPHAAHERSVYRRVLAVLAPRRVRRTGRSVEAEVASVMASFLVQATEGRALKQAIDARRAEVLGRDRQVALETPGGRHGDAIHCDPAPHWRSPE